MLGSLLSEVVLVMGISFLVGALFLSVITTQTQTFLTYSFEDSFKRSEGLFYGNGTQQ